MVAGPHPPGRGTRAAAALLLLATTGTAAGLLPPPAAPPPPYAWMLGGTNETCDAACAAVGRACFPAAAPGWSGWPADAAELEQALASALPGGGGGGEAAMLLCPPASAVGSSSEANPTVYSTEALCYFDAVGHNSSCAAAPPGKGRRLWCGAARPVGATR